MSFTVWPAPGPPRWVALAASRSSNGRARATSASLPPSISVSRPSSAAGAPPDSGASTQPMPQASRNRAAIDAVRPASMLDISTSSAASEPAAATPSAPNTACSTIAALLRLVTTNSAAPAAARGLSTGRPPRSASAAARAGSRSQRKTSAPVSIRRAAIADPITPTPITATRILSVLHRRALDDAQPDIDDPRLPAPGFGIARQQIEQHPPGALAKRAEIDVNGGERRVDLPADLEIAKAHDRHVF